MGQGLREGRQLPRCHTSIRTHVRRAHNTLQHQTHRGCCVRATGAETSRRDPDPLGHLGRSGIVQVSGGGSYERDLDKGLVPRSGQSLGPRTERKQGRQGEGDCNRGRGPEGRATAGEGDRTPGGRVSAAAAIGRTPTSGRVYHTGSGAYIDSSARPEVYELNGLGREMPLRTIPSRPLCWSRDSLFYDAGCAGA